MVRVPVHLPAPAGRSGLNIWRSSTEPGSGGSQSWAQESSAEGLHQLHGSVVLERGREEVGTGGDSCGGKRSWERTQPPACTSHSPPPPCSTFNTAPSSLTATPAHTLLGATAPELLSLLLHQPGPTPSVCSAQRTLPQPGQAQHLPSDRWPEGTAGILPTPLPTPHTQEPQARWPPCSCPRSKERAEGRGGVQG